MKYLSSDNIRALNRNFVVLSLIVFVFLAFSISGIGCKSIGSDTKSVTNKTNTTTTANTAVPTSTPSATATVVKPKLEQVAFTLSFKPLEQYKEYTFPIFLTSKNILHLVWTVSGEGENIRMAITIPGGQYIGLTVDGAFNAMSPNEPCDQLYRSGSITLRPSEQEWTSGYYVFHPHIYAADKPISAKILYWID